MKRTAMSTLREGDQVYIQIEVRDDRKGTSTVVTHQCGRYDLLTLLSTASKAVCSEFGPRDNEPPADRFATRAPLKGRK